MVVKCHEFFGCKRKQECPFYNYEGEKSCWEVDLSLTPFVPAGKGEKEVFCSHCLYYQHAHEDRD